MTTQLTTETTPDEATGGAPRPLAPLSGSQTRALARMAAFTVHDAFDAYHSRFKAITRRSQQRFEQRAWAQWQADAAERLEVYEVTIRSVVAGLRQSLNGETGNKALWQATKAQYARLIANRKDVELAESFFNSVTRRVLTTIGVDDSLEFVWFGATTLPTGTTPIVRLYVQMSTVQVMIRSILEDYDFAAPYGNKEQDAHKVADALTAYLAQIWDAPDFDCIEMLQSVFYRNKGAYLIGRIRKRNRVIPIILPLRHDEAGIWVDTVLLNEADASVLFSFTRSYFHVEVEIPGDLVGFLKSLMPYKPIAELYIAIGYNKHGKTERFRALYRHLANSSDKFEIARGAKGMVMTVFTLPSYDVVFKIIKDRFAEPKTTTRAQVMERYRFVFTHDRVGRMVDAQEFEQLTFSRDRFSAELLEELAQVAANTVTITDDAVIIAHLYTERRVYPLDLYIKEMHPNKAAAAVIDYGNAIADMAAANVFPGDLFIKNFGVTRHGRVVFYDYDELCLLSECNFRAMPASDDYDDETAGQPWFSVSPSDVFPEEFRHFLWFPAPLRRVMEQHHSRLFTAAWWQEMQRRNLQGEVIDFFPYAAEKRFEGEIV